MMRLAATLLAAAVPLALAGWGCGSEITVMPDRSGGLVGGRPDAGATGDDLTGQCWDCITELGKDACKATQDACKADPPCEDYLLCQKYCGWAHICDEACAAQYPEGKAAFQPMPECYVCSHCSGACADWWVYAEYCGSAPDGGP
ncbi:MAG: hypothetical protein JRI68_03230 [Deltaproteobacteria bacterium]|nr:hypothetical protein [Deltaproteobacteria bacterium]